MNYELAKELKDAGFPQHERLGIGHGDEFIQDGDNPLIYVPTLSELIEACGEGFDCLMKQDDFWVVNHTNDAHGPTPEIALSKLYLALNPPHHD